MCRTHTYQDPNSFVDIDYGMAYFGLQKGAVSQPDALVVGADTGLFPTRLKENVQGLLQPVVLKKATALSSPAVGEGKQTVAVAEEGWSRQVLAMGNAGLANNGLTWWSNFGASYEGGGALKVREKKGWR